MSTSKKAILEAELQADLRELAANWSPDDTNLVAVKATGIERSIPPESQHEDAKKAREYCKQARRFGITEKGFMYLVLAESAKKDFELYDGYAQKAKANADARAAARNPRQKDPLRASIIAVMRLSKRSHDDFKSFMQMWRLGHLNGLTAKSIENGNRYIITDENIALGEKTYAWSTLEKMYSGN